jgi:hypothetical protein
MRGAAHAKIQVRAGIEGDYEGCPRGPRMKNESAGSGACRQGASFARCGGHGQKKKDGCATG